MNIGNPDPNNVDLLNTARETQLRDVLGKQSDSIKVIAPAKVNLELRVGDVRDDGYHEVNTVMHALALHDVLYVRRVPYVNEVMGPVQTKQNVKANNTNDSSSSNNNDNNNGSKNCEGVCNNGDRNNAKNTATPPLQVKTVMIGCDGIEVPPVDNEDNLVTKAVRLLAEKIAHGKSSNKNNTGESSTNSTSLELTDKPDEHSNTTPECVEIRVEKHIPSQAGLGGGSSDAAATLVGVAQLWDIAPDDPILKTCAKELGSDVPFFLQGGCVEYAGRGDEFVRTLEPAKTNVLLVKPHAGLSTAEVYRSFDVMHTDSSANPSADSGAVAKVSSKANKSPEASANPEANSNSNTNACSGTKPNETSTGKNYTSASNITPGNNTECASGVTFANNTKPATSITPTNNLTPAAEHIMPNLRDLRLWLTNQPCVSNVIMCGSGSCLCAFCDSFTNASRLSASPHLQNCWTRTTALANLKATVVPSS